ncbi:MAG TPA: amidohydrolase family protein [Acidimicrobiia bacterium]|nr:amidohydrolase family protein [Acidimicrobiia bacterium]
MPVIDVDSHFQGPFTWFDQEHPELAEQLPEVPAPMMINALVTSLCGEALATLPPEVRPDDMMELVPDLWKPLAEQFAAKSSLAEIDELIYETDAPLGAGELAPRIDRLFRAKGGWDMDERVCFLDEAGIDVQLVSGNNAPVYPGLDPDLAKQCIAAANDSMIDRIGAHIDRLLPITYVMMEDVEWSIAEMTRMRGLGSRAVHIRATPVEGKSLAHPHFDPFWAAVTDLGMVGYLHAGSGRAFVDPAWGNNGGVFDSVTIMGAAQYQQVPTMLCGALVTSGVFERFPTLTIVNAELGGHIWLPNFLGWMDAFVDDPKISSLQCKFDYPLKPSEYARRNVRVSPLPVVSMPVRDYLEDLDGMLVFSSDYPHPEGLDADAVQWYREHFGDIAADVQGRFFSDSMAEVYERMGDPLDLPTPVAM